MSQKPLAQLLGATQMEVRILRSRIIIEAPQNTQFSQELNLVERRVEKCLDGSVRVNQIGQRSDYRSRQESVQLSTEICNELIDIRRRVSGLIRILDSRKAAKQLGNYSYLSVGTGGPSGPPNGLGKTVSFQNEAPTPNPNATVFSPTGSYYSNATSFGTPMSTNYLRATPYQNFLDSPAATPGSTYSGYNSTDSLPFGGAGSTGSHWSR